MSAELEIFLPERAVNLVIDLAQVNKLVAHVITGFIKKLYNTGYIIASINPEALDIINKSISEKIFISKYEFYKEKYTGECLLFLAEKYNLPVALLQDKLKLLVKELYLRNYIFGSIYSQDFLEEHLSHIKANKKIFLTLKQLQENK